MYKNKRVLRNIRIFPYKYTLVYYIMANKTASHPKVTCSCGLSISEKNLSTHLKLSRHQKHLQLKQMKQMPCATPKDEKSENLVKETALYSGVVDQAYLYKVRNDYPKLFNYIQDVNRHLGRQSENVKRIARATLRF
jgi:hypothetical protein